MDFKYSEKSAMLQDKLAQFMEVYVYPHEKEYTEFVLNPDNHWKRWPKLEELKAQAKSAGLWNLFLPKNYGTLSPGLTNLEYAPLAEQMGKLRWASEIFNCSAPDTGNMEVLAKYGSEEQKKQWLMPLMNGEIRSAFLMTEPDVASSDATNIQTSIVADGDDYIINGTKWWSSGAMDPHCKIAIVMGKTNPDGERHAQQSMILVPMDHPNLKIIRPLTLLGYICLLYTSPSPRD